MKQNSIKIYTQALCCALAVCSASDFACGMNDMDVKQEKVNDISAETAISCMQDIDKAASVVWELNKQMSISERDVYAAFEKVGIPEDEVILDPNELTVQPSGTSFVWISEGRIETLVMYLCSRIYMDLPFENKFTNAVNYEFDPYEQLLNNCSNYECCLAFFNRIEYVFGDIYGYINYYVDHYLVGQTESGWKETMEIELWDKWLDICFDIETELESMY